MAGAGIAKKLSDGNRFWTFAGSIGGATLIGLGKEAVDAGQRENGWDNDDLMATVLGGLSVGVTIDIFTDRKGRREKKLREKYTQFKPDTKVETPEWTNADQLPTMTELTMPTMTLE